MTTRRGFVAGAAAGIAFCGCGLSAAGRAQGAARLPVTIAGKPVRTIDVHAHCLFPDAVALVGAEEAQRVLTPVNGADNLRMVVAERLRQMDAMAIDIEVLSINPFWYRKDRDTAAAIVTMQNDKLAELVAAHPDRFAAFASLTLQFPDLAVEQLEHAVTKLGLRGAQIGANVAGVEFSDPKFHQVWAKAEDLGAVLFIHPQSTPELAGRFRGNGWLSNTIGNPLDTTIALEHLIFEGTLDRFPGLKILAAHGGGFLGSYPARSDHACMVAPPGGCNPDIRLARKPTEYLRQLYYDALVFTPEALRHLVAEVGASQVMLGSDHPFVWEQHPVDHVLATDALSDHDKAAILGGNAARLFGIAT